MSGRHNAADEPREPRRRRPLVPAAVATAVVVLLLGGAFVAVNLGSDDGEFDNASTAVADERSAAGRADRADRSEPAAVPSPSPSAVPPSSAVPVPSKTPTKTPSKKPTSAPPATEGGVVSSGTCGASYYDTGQTTANGERFNPDGLTAAHKTLKFNTRVKVTNTANGKSVVVRINDRGPFVGGRCLDLARGAFVTIASVNAGVINARYEVLK